MSNPVFFTSLVGTNAKIVFRFFASQAANFVLENKVFEITSNKKLSPEMIQSDYKSYRVEKYYNGAVFKTNEIW